MGLTNCNTQIWISPTSGVQKPYNLYINKLIVLRLLQGIYNHLTRLQQGRKHCNSMVASTLYETRLLQPKVSIWENTYTYIWYVNLQTTLVNLCCIRNLVN